MQDQNQFINKRKNILAIKQLCTDLGVEFLDVDTQTTMTRSREDIGYARDYMHGGPKIHCEIADMFLKKYEQNQINLSSQ
jgi:hypothetical protein